MMELPGPRLQQFSHLQPFKVVNEPDSPTAKQQNIVLIGKLFIEPIITQN